MLQGVDMQNTESPQAAVFASAMRHALSLATRGPKNGENPQVGCVILTPDNRIVAEGWHLGAGTKHAETDALAHLPAEWIGRESQLTAVVTLEPCNHTGHTGPCAEALIEAGIGRVVYALADPGAESSGGAERLRNVGVEVIGGVLETEARMFLAGWLATQRRSVVALTHSDPPQRAKRPRVIAKWAQTLDGRAAAHDGSSQWITGPEARAHVHAMRALADAIAVGTGTAFSDNPSLTARADDGSLLVPAELQPIPVVFGRRSLFEGSRISEHPALAAHGLEAAPQFTGEDLTRDLEELGAMGVESLYVEGGPTLVSALLAARLIDELHVYLAPKLLGGDGVALTDLGVATIADAFELSVASVTRLGPDLLITAAPHHSLHNAQKASDH